MKKILLGLLFSTSAFAQTTVLRPNSLQVGRGASDKQIIFDKGSGAANPRIVWDNSDGAIQFSNNGSTFKNLGSSPIISSKTANYTSTETDDVIFVSGAAGAFAITLHTPSFNQKLVLKRTDNTLANVISITGTIDGETDFKLHTLGELYELQYSTVLGSWSVLSHNTSTAWIEYTPTLTGFGTTTSVDVYWRRVGDSMQVKGSFTTGADSTAVEARLSLAGSSVIAGSTKHAVLEVAGRMVSDMSDSMRVGAVLADRSVAYLTFSGVVVSSTNEYSKRLGSYFGGPTIITFQALVPIEGWKP